MKLMQPVIQLWFSGLYCIHLQSWRVCYTSKQQKMAAGNSPKCWYTCATASQLRRHWSPKWFLQKPQLAEFHLWTWFLTILTDCVLQYHKSTCEESYRLNTAVLWYQHHHRLRYNLDSRPVVSGDSLWKLSRGSANWHNKHLTALVRTRWRQGWMTQVFAIHETYSITKHADNQKTNGIIIKLLKCGLTTIIHVASVIYVLNTAKTNCFLSDNRISG
jgi:hypothetical protein